MLPENLPKLGFRPGVEDLLCTHLCTWAHAHIQGGILREAESSVPLVNLRSKSKGYIFRVSEQTLSGL